MKKKQQKVQLILLFAGIILFVLTYLFYPYINKNKLSKDQIVSSDSVADKSEETVDEKESTTFENLEYEGLYDFDKPFTVQSEKAYILDEKPSVVFMKNMKVTLYFNDERMVIITSDEGHYNKETYDCYFEKNVVATDGETQIFGDNLSLLATKNVAKIYNDVILNHSMGTLQADEIDYNFETKNFRVSMYDEKPIKMKVIQ